MLFLQTILCVDDYGGNFAEKVQKVTLPTVVMFYTPWCPHYQKFQQTWEKLQMDKVIFAQVNCVENRDICQEENIKDYPTLRLYKDGQFQAKYKGQRNPELIYQWLAAKLR
ncbi:Thioredoxin_domain-containing protein [Hexamita inflata]|uniref:Thioredoxin domain-containing protein n=1 Tax=Hexamita inflata TaxID=28002 RepID=A0AA86PEB2_9EUKA|nr:Thioredoxin domain-containing protein [Hexamita inflata]